jgi:hypothetical protein
MVALMLQLCLESVMYVLMNSTRIKDKGKRKMMSVFLSGDVG